MTLLPTRLQSYRALVAAVPLIIIAVLCTSCSVETLDPVAATDPEELEVGIDPIDEPDAVEQSSDREPAEEVDEFSLRDDDICLGEEDGEFTYVVGYQVVDGILGNLCAGDESPALIDAWNVLVDIVPPGQLRDLASFTGFTNESGDLLAFVAAADESGSIFEMAVNVGQTDNKDELHLTLVHEFSHVFTATPNELDRAVDDADCDTYWNGEGCYLADSIMAEWVRLFWADKVNDFDPTAPESADDADQRCSLEPGFFGPYAGTSPEEDFAESFAAYVLQVPDETDGQLERLEWIGSQPGLTEFRDRAASTNYGPLPHTFDPCGS